jgi:type III pantothenate kinase
VGSVVPELNGIFSDLLKRITGQKPLILDHTLHLGIRIGTEFPEKVGHDRIANAVAAYDEYKSSLIIIDCGTATTFDVINADGIFEGGVICPGMIISAEALYSKAAQLFQVNFEKPKHLVGKNTTESMQSGIFNGYCAMIEALLEKIMKDLLIRNQPKPKVILTGGYALKISDELPNAIIQEDLTLRGLSLIHFLNRK